MRQLIAIPCYNCETQIVRVLDDLAKLKIDNTSDILLINNRSTDKTQNIALAKIQSLLNKKRYTFILNDQNYGLGGSQKVAFNYAINTNYDFVTILHGDDQASVADYPRLITNSINNHCTTLGSRFMKKSKRFGYQKSRVVGNIVLNFIFSIVTLRMTKDLGSGLNTFLVSDLKKISYSKLTDSFNFNVELLLSFFKLHLKLKFLPITWSETDQISNAKNLNVALSMLKSLFIWRFHFLSKQNDILKPYPYKIIQ